MTQDEKLWWSNFREANRSYLENDEYRKICEIHAREFKHKVDYVCKCNPSRIQQFINEINQKFEQLWKQD